MPSRRRCTRSKRGCASRCSRAGCQAVIGAHREKKGYVLNKHTCTNPCRPAKTHTQARSSPATYNTKQNRVKLISTLHSTNLKTCVSSHLISTEVLSLLMLCPLQRLAAIPLRSIPGAYSSHLNGVYLPWLIHMQDEELEHWTFLVSLCLVDSAARHPTVHHTSRFVHCIALCTPDCRMFSGGGRR